MSVVQTYILNTKQARNSISKAPWAGSPMRCAPCRAARAWSMGALDGAPDVSTSSYL